MKKQKILLEDGKMEEIILIEAKLGYSLILSVRIVIFFFFPFFPPLN
jgi:hypothetical protein